MNGQPTDDMICRVEGRLGRLRLNRPKALHALNLPMVQAMTDALVQWRDAPEVALIVVDHAEGRGFCAGGDVVGIARSAGGDGAPGDAFFAGEYRMNHLMFTYPKAGVVFMDGITMGGGVGIAGPWRYRVATENTVLAMPETGIGLFPDVGGGRYLSRLPGRIGQYLGLTGDRLSGAECVAVGLATHYIPSERLEEVKRQLGAAPADVEAILDAAAAPVEQAAILANVARIDRYFASDRFEDIVDALASNPSDWADKTLATLRRMSPSACKITLRLLAKSREIEDFADEMRLEYALVHRVFRAPDFREGVRALLIDKDKAPKWSPARPEEISDAAIDALFAPLPPELAWTPLAI